MEKRRHRRIKTEQALANSCYKRGLKLQIYSGRIYRVMQASTLLFSDTSFRRTVARVLAKPLIHPRKREAN